MAKKYCITLLFCSEGCSEVCWDSPAHLFPTGRISLRGPSWCQAAVARWCCQNFLCFPVRLWGAWCSIIVQSFSCFRKASLSQLLLVCSCLCGVFVVFVGKWVLEPPSPSSCRPPCPVNSFFIALWSLPSPPSRIPRSKWTSPWMLLRLRHACSHERKLKLRSSAVCLLIFVKVFSNADSCKDNAGETNAS